MLVGKRVGQAVAATVVAGGLLGFGVAPATAWPLPLSSDDVNYLSAIRGGFPGNDDQLMLAGKQACRMLYTGQGGAATINATAAQYGASPEQAANLVGAARGTMCTQAPG